MKNEIEVKSKKKWGSGFINTAGFTRILISAVALTVAGFIFFPFSISQKAIAAIMVIL